MSPKKSIARRRPVTVFRVDTSDDGTEFTVKVWIATDPDMPRTDRYAGKVTEDEYSGPRAQGWFDSRDTASLHRLPTEVLDALFEIDDRVREALRHESNAE